MIRCGVWKMKLDSGTAFVRGLLRCRYCVLLEASFGEGGFFLISMKITGTFDF